MIAHHYNYILVIISIIVAIISSYTALTLSQRMVYARQAGSGHLNWLLASAVVLGIGIWSMHFVAMLAYVVNVEVRYRVDLTLLSVIFAILGTGIGFWIVDRGSSVVRIVASGIFMGFAIVSMHYTGMAGYHAGVSFTYSVPIVCFSIFIAVGASIVGLWTIFRSNFNRRVQILASVILGIAISGMHYTGMLALSMFPDPEEYCGGVTSDPFLWTFNTNYLATITVGVISAIAIVSYIVINHSVKTSEFIAREDRTLRYANKMETIGQLTGGIAHDFRNILAVMKSGVTMLERGKSVEEIAPLMQQSLDKGYSLVEQLLSFTRQRTTNKKIINLTDIVSLNNLLLTKVLPPSIRLTFDVKDEVSVQVDSDACSLALMNLVINARDAMAEGGSICIQVIREVENNLSYAHISVTDTGCGMTEEVRNKVFKPFFTTKAEGKGTGLGLPQVNGFVKESTGTISIESELGRGTTVHIYLPENK